MEFVDALTIESWTLWVLGVLFVTCRLVSQRILHAKWMNLAIEDYLMVSALTIFAGVVVCSKQVAKNGSNHLSAERAGSLTENQKNQVIFGSKMMFVLEILTLTALWIVKACLFMLCSRLMKKNSLKKRRVVEAVAGYCILTYAFVMSFFILYWCNPTYEYWSVPVKIEQCATYYNHTMLTTACNISTDLLLFSIPICVVTKTRLPKKTKIGLYCVFGLGVFNVLAAISKSYYTFTYSNSYNFLHWYVAEVGVAIYVGNLPLCLPAIERALGCKGDSSNPSRPDPSSPASTSTHHGYPNRLMRKSSLWTVRDSGDDRQTDRLPNQGGEIELVNQNRPDLV